MCLNSPYDLTKLWTIEDWRYGYNFIKYSHLLENYPSIVYWKSGHNFYIFWWVDVCHFSLHDHETIYQMRKWSAEQRKFWTTKKRREISAFHSLLIITLSRHSHLWNSYYTSVYCKSCWAQKISEINLPSPEAAWALNLQLLCREDERRRNWQKSKSKKFEVIAQLLARWNWDFSFQ